MTVLRRSKWLGAGAGIALGLGALALAGSPAMAQDANASAGGAPTYYKGKGAGGRNHYIYRWEEDYSYLAAPDGSFDASKSTDFFDPLKYIPFGKNTNSYMSLSFDNRDWYWNFQEFTFVPLGGSGQRTSDHVSRGGGPGLGLAQSQWYLSSETLGADIHVTDNFRAFIALSHGTQDGNNTAAGCPAGCAPGTVGTNTGGSITNKINVFDYLLELKDAFIEPMGHVDTPWGRALVGVRFGVQQMELGNGLIVSDSCLPTYCPNTLIGPRAYFDLGWARIDAFAMDQMGMGSSQVGMQGDFFPNASSGQFFTASNQSDSNLWGIYTSFDLPTVKGLMFGENLHSTIEPFYIGYRYANATMGSASLAASPTYAWNYMCGPSGGALTCATGQNLLQTVGARYFGDAGNWDFDYTAVYQGGSLGGASVSAFMFATDNGYTLHNVMFKPRFGLNIDGNPGGMTTSSNGTVTGLSGYQPMSGTAGTAYLGTINNDPDITNVFHVAPSLRADLLENVRALFKFNMYWRWSGSEAIDYGPSQGAFGALPNVFGLTGMPLGTTSLGGVAQTGSPHSMQYAETAPEINVSWAPIPHVFTFIDLTEAIAGPALYNVGARDATLVWVAVGLSF